MRAAKYETGAGGRDDAIGEARIPLHGLRVDGSEVWYRLEVRVGVDKRGARKAPPPRSTVAGEVCLIFSEPPPPGAVQKIPVGCMY